MPFPQKSNFFWWCLRTGNEKSTFALSVAAYHVPENVLTFSSVNIISDTVTEIQAIT